MDIYLLLSFLTFAVSLAFSIRALRKHGRVKPFHALFFGAFVSIALLLLPFSKELSLNALLATIHSVIRVFVADAGFDMLDPTPGALYFGWTALMLILAPVLTFGYVLSYFQNLMARFRLKIPGLFCGTWYVFSHLNEQSLAFAESVPDGEKPLLVFAGRSDADESLLTRAGELGAVLIDGMNICCVKPGKKTEAVFFAISEDGYGNVDLALEIIERHGKRNGARLYVFASDNAAELVLNSALKQDDCIVVRRVNAALSLVHRTLYDESIFENAAEEKDGKFISAVVIGLGGIGSQLLRSLCWCGQMDGYRLEIQAFDKSPDAAEALAAQCPSLLEHSGKGGGDEDRYTLALHGGVDFNTNAFRELVKPATQVFIAMDSDRDNINAAVEARAVFERMGCFPRIYAFVHDPIQARLLRGQELKNFKGQEYGVKIIGSLSEQYSYNNLLHSELERAAYAIHVNSGSPDDYFRRYDYCFRSSIASAIHAKWTRVLGVTPSPVLEHKRWVAYMRSIGYRYSPERSDRAGLHPAMVPYGKLPQNEKQKDIDISK